MEKKLTAATQECCEQYWASPGGNTPQNSNCSATYHPSRKLSKLDKPYMRDTAGVGTSSKVMFSCGPLHIAEQRLGDQLEPTYSSSVRIRDIALRTCRKRWTIGRGWQKGVRDIRAGGTTWWWWWWQKPVHCVELLDEFVYRNSYIFIYIRSILLIHWRYSERIKQFLIYLQLNDNYGEFPFALNICVIGLWYWQIENWPFYIFVVFENPNKLVL